MSLTEIVLYVDGATSWSSRVAAAVELARESRAHLVGVGVSTPMSLIGLEHVPTSVFAEIEQMRRREAELDAERFAAAMRAADYTARSEWRSVEGMPVEALALQARYADRTIVSQGTGEWGGWMSEDPGDPAIGSGRPILVIP